jgi:hypothetical protein
MPGICSGWIPVAGCGDPERDSEGEKSEKEKGGSLFSLSLGTAQLGTAQSVSVLQVVTVP